MTKAFAGKFLFPYLLTLYFFSGLVSLAYEILWARMLSLQFGVSIFGVVITVAVFMLGLGVGSLLGARYAKNSSRPILWFAIFECLVGVIALIIPQLFQGLDKWLSQSAQTTDLAGWYLLQFGATGFILLIPALLMGAGFPFILHATREHAGRVEYLYGINTLGATAGALIPLLLLPVYGWSNSLIIIATGSLVVSGLAFAAYLFIRNKRENLPETDQPARISTLTLFSYGAIGAVALMLEIAWTRLFGMIFLRTEYVLAIILAIFLLGIGAGSIIARYLKKDYWLQLLPIHAAVLVTAGLWLLPLAVTWIDPNTMHSLGESLLNQGIVIFILTFPVTVIFGAWLPLLNRLLGATGHGGASLYGANSVGATVGALTAGFLLIPLIGSTETIVLSALLLLLFSMAWVRDKKFLLALPLIIILGIPVLNMPEVSQLLPRLYSNTSDLYRYEDAVNITHVVEQPDGQRMLLADLQRMDASSDPSSVESQRNQARLPMLLHPHPQSVLFLGLGTAITVSATKDFPGLSRTAVELSQGAIFAAEKYFNEVNLGVLGQTQVIRDDARHFLMSTANYYDVIVGDLFHPDLVGRSALLSIQQFQRVKSRLSKNGVYVQWIALNQFETQSLKIILRTFKQVFPDSMLFLDAFRLALVGTQSTFTGHGAVRQNIERLNEVQANSITGGEGYWTWLGRYWGPIHVGNGVVQDEWNPQIEFKLPSARYSGELDLSKILEYVLSIRPHVNDAARQLDIEKSEFEKFERAYAGTELGVRSWLALLYDQSEKGQRLLKLAYQANPRDKWIGFAVADAAIANFDLNANADISETRLLESVLQIRPDHPEALKRLWKITESNGSAMASVYRDRLKQLSPYDKSLGSYISQ